MRGKKKVKRNQKANTYHRMKTANIGTRKWKAHVAKMQKERLKKLLAPESVQVLSPMVARDSVEFLGQSILLIRHIISETIDRVDLSPLPSPGKEAFLKQLSMLNDVLVDTSDMQQAMLDVLKSINKINDSVKYSNL